MGAKIEKAIAACALFAALLACGSPRSIAWDPVSASAHTNQIAVSALHVGIEDLSAIQTADGYALGTMTMKGRSEERTGAEAAEYGGTHYLSGRLGTDGSLLPPMGRDPQFVVYRVPTNRWGVLPQALRPELHKRK
jgi:hypothetical protein